MIETILNFLDIWNEKKKKIITKNKTIFVKERDIVFINMGQNIGIEQDGKGEEFLRPVIVYKKFNNSMFLGVPLTSAQKQNKFYYAFEFQSKTDGVRSSSAILSQIRAFDTKRAKFKLGVIGKSDFDVLHKNLSEVIKPNEVTPHKNGESPEGICKVSITQKNKEVKNDG